MGVEAFGARKRFDGVTEGFEAISVDVDDVEILHEVAHRERAGEPSGAIRGQHVARSSYIVAERGGRIRPTKDRTSVPDERQEGIVVGRLELEVLGRNEICNRHCLLRRPTDDSNARRLECGFNIGSARCTGHQALNRGNHLVGERSVPRDEPCKPIGSVLGLQDHIDCGEVGRYRTVGDNHHLRRPGER